MKRYFPDLLIWLVCLALFLMTAWPATNLSSEYRQPGDVLVRMANDTNVVVLPVVEKVQTWLQVAQNILTGALTVIAALLAVWGKLRSNKATESGTIASVLIQEIQKVASKEFKDNIADAAREAGVGDALHSKVKDETDSSSVFPIPSGAIAEMVSSWPKSPRDYTSEQKANPVLASVTPVVPISNPNEVKPI